MDTTRHHLSPDTYLCLADDQVVLLDLRRNKYLALAEEASSTLRPHVDLLSSQEGMPSPDSEPHLGAVLAELSARGLVSTATTLPSTWGIPRPIAPTSAIEPMVAFQERIGLHHVAHYIACVLRAKSALRVRSLYRVVLTERRKHLSRAAGCGTFDFRRATVLYSIYSRLRVLATGPRQCLFDSLALKLFLAEYGVFPHWIFGVRLNPFSAHCWLQYGNTLVNDSLDFVRRFTPIMAA